MGEKSWLTCRAPLKALARIVVVPANCPRFEYRPGKLPTHLVLFVCEIRVHCVNARLTFMWRPLKGSEPVCCSRYSDSLWAGRFGYRIPVGTRFSASTQRLVKWAPGLFLGGKAAGTWCLPPTPMQRRG
jgi:hypothetical protein